jgi:protein-histidine pros-kinase
VVKGSLQVLNNEKMDKLTPRQLHYLKVALKGNQLAINLVNDLLSMTRIDSGKWQLQPQPVDLTAVVNELVEEFQPARQEKQLRLTAHLPQAEVKVKADRKLLRIAIKNLVDNAIKYTLSGSVTVAIEVSDEIRVEVADTGIGVKEISRPDLFQKFTRSDEAIHASPNGFGIGLYYSRAIIRQHGGDITFKPNSPAGSVFSIHLPLTALIK